MKRVVVLHKWRSWCLLGALWLCIGCCQASQSSADVSFVFSPAEQPPDDNAPWQTTRLPDVRTPPAGSAVWYRLRFASPEWPDHRLTALYLPYFYTGGAFFWNGLPLARLRGADTQTMVRWERPHLLPLPVDLTPHTLAPVLYLRIHTSPSIFSHHMPQLHWGPVDELLPAYETRLFWIRVIPQTTMVACCLMAGALIFLWWRRQSETLFAILGIASLLWGVRTLTFVVEVLPMAGWWLWRVLYYAATGGFIIAMAVFALRFARLHWPRWERGLGAYGLLGPVVMLLGGLSADHWVGRIWSAGLIPIGLLLLGLSAYAAWTQRSNAAKALLLALGLAVGAGIHDYLLAWSSPVLLQWLPSWSEQRFFLLHHAANLLLLVTVAILVNRFATTLDQVELLNTTLEQRVADREAELAHNYQTLTQLTSQKLLEEERSRIMRDMHDGLGSQLFTSLSRVERGEMDREEVSAMLRHCIAEMRLTLEAMSPADGDFASLLGNFRYRWDGILKSAGLQPLWRIEVPDSPPLRLHTDLRLDVLRVLQEALTNVIKHAQARTVEVVVRYQAAEGMLYLRVKDDGCGFPAVPPTQDAAKCGLKNINNRAKRLAGSVKWSSGSQGTTLELSFLIKLQF